MNPVTARSSTQAPAAALEPISVVTADFGSGWVSHFSTLRIVGVLEGETLWLASITDCWCVGAKGDDVTRLAWEKTSHARAEYKRLGEVSAREQLRNKPEHPNSYGACTGEPEAMTFVEYGNV